MLFHKNIKLTRLSFCWIGLGIIILYIFLNRFNFIWGSSITEGRVDAFRIIISATNSYNEPVIKFFVDSKEITFTDDNNLDLELGQNVTVIYKKDNPGNARVYSFTGFWLNSIIWALIPTIIFLAAIFSFMNKQDYILIDLSRLFKVRWIKENQLKNLEENNKNDRNGPDHNLIENK